jgi:hypothetical protein
MSTRARLRRLERLKRLKRARRPDYSCPAFVIAPELARAIVEDYKRLKDLLGRRRLLAISPVFAQFTKKPDPAAEEEVAARLAGHLRGIRCPPDYWANQADTDRKDVQRFFTGNEPLASCDEAIELQARLIVFGGSPDGALWRTMMGLHYRRRTRAQQAELDQPHRRYPGMPLKHYDPQYETTRHLEEIIRERRGKDRFTWHGYEDAIWKCVERRQ